MKKAVCILFVVALFATLSYGATYSQVYTNAQIVAGNTATQVYGCAADTDGSVYFLVASSPAVTKIDASGNSSTIMTYGTWNFLTAKTTCTGMYGFSVDGDYVEFSDTATSNIYKLNKTTKALSVWAYASDIKALTGAASASLKAPNGAYNGSFYAYDSASTSVIKVNAAGVLSVYMPSSAVASAGGTLSTGLTFDNSGRMLVGSASNGVYRFDGSNVETLLTASQLLGVIGGTTTSMTDLLYGNDGKAYLAVGSGSNKSIVSFDPTNASTAASTLSILLSASDLLSGPAGSNNVYQLTWYNNNLAFNCGGTTGTKGFYSVPEPATLSLLALSGLFLRRFRK
jgi:hypothetical protein